MITRFFALAATFLILLCNFCKGQNFINGDLDGVVTGSSCLPFNWLNVPFDDPNCLALQVGNDTPDLTSTTGPGSMVVGAIGNPFSGSTFVSGNFASSSSNFFQEGIMQNVIGLVPNEKYIIRLYQTVVKHNVAIDKSGSWAIYIDTLLVGITEPTYSNEPYASFNMPWELRSVSFIASTISHWIKFLPLDDDSNFVASAFDTTGALRMGIDSISLSIVTGIEEMLHESAIKLYPNPASDVLRIEMQNHFAGIITITNALGKVLYQSSTEKNSSQFSIDLREFPPGLYFVSFRNEGGGVNKRFVKN
jgi:hypothetical protein